MRGKAYMAPITSSHRTPSTVLRVSVAMRAFSAKSPNTSLFSYSYDYFTTLWLQRYHTDETNAYENHGRIIIVFGSPGVSGGPSKMWAGKDIIDFGSNRFGSASAYYWTKRISKRSMPYKKDSLYTTEWSGILALINYVRRVIERASTTVWGRWQCTAWNCEISKCDTILQRWNMRDIKMREALSMESQEWTSIIVRVFTLYVYVYSN